MTLPLLLSVPHAGLEVPDRLASRCLLTPQQVLVDGDEGAAAIYDLAEHVAHYVTTPIARAVLDMNRAEDDRRLDGVVKTHTCWGEPVWREALGSDDVEWLLARHHRPYHAALSAGHDDVILAVDCHTMAAHGPPVGPDPDAERPAACLSDGAGTSCPRPWIEALRDLLAGTLDREVRINDPFQGGYITRTHGRERPWVQLELSRAPFMSVAEKRAAVLEALDAWSRRHSGG